MCKLASTLPRHSNTRIEYQWPLSSFLNGSIYGLNNTPTVPSIVVKACPLLGTLTVLPSMDSTHPHFHRMYCMWTACCTHTLWVSWMLQVMQDSVGLCYLACRTVMQIKTKLREILIVCVTVKMLQDSQYCDGLVSHSMVYFCLTPSISGICFTSTKTPASGMKYALREVCIIHFNNEMLGGKNEWWENMVHT